MAEKNENAEKKGKGTKTSARIELRNGKIGIGRGKKHSFWPMSHFNILIIATVVNKGGRLIKDQLVKFFNGIEEIGTAKTDNTGKAELKYHDLSTDYLRNNFDGREIKVRAEAVIDGMFVESPELTIKLNLPAGGIKKGLQAAKIRRYYLLGSSIKAMAISAFIFFSLNYAAGGIVNFVLGLLAGFLIYWLAGKKISNSHRIIKIVLASILPITCWWSPKFITGPMTFALCYAFFAGGFFFFLEELWRRADGKPVLNFYPLWPMIFAASFVLFKILGFIHGIVPDSPPRAEFIDFSVKLKLSGAIDFSRLQNSSGLVEWFKELLSYFTAQPWHAWLFSVIFLVYGVPGELWDKFTGKGKINVGGNDLMGAALFSSLWLFISKLFKGKGVKI